MKALILVDLQYDFMPGGALAVPEGDKVVAVANRLIPHFDVVVATQDWHPANHKSFASQHEGKSAGDSVMLGAVEQILWPDHCVQGTKGAEFHRDLTANSITHVVQKGMNQEIDSYSGFFDNDHLNSTGLDQWLNDNEVSSVAVMGLATDYCVKFTVLDAVDLGMPTQLIIDGCRGVNINPTDVEQALADMMSAGVELVKSDQWIKANKQKD